MGEIAVTVRNRGAHAAVGYVNRRSPRARQPPSARKGARLARHKVMDPIANPDDDLTVEKHNLFILTPVDRSHRTMPR